MLAHCRLLEQAPGFGTGDKVASEARSESFYRVRQSRRAQEGALLADAHVLALQALQRGLLLLAQRERLRHPPAPLLLHCCRSSFLCRCT